ncbi:hypothetical protein JOD29_001795 [Lysinibacillus composti]|nr:hypothetical protein [Lysinibacillus composti]
MTLRLGLYLLKRSIKLVVTSVVGTVVVGGYIVCILTGKRGILTDINSLRIDVTNGWPVSILMIIICLKILLE